MSGGGVMAPGSEHPRASCQRGASPAVVLRDLGPSRLAEGRGRLPEAGVFSPLWSDLGTSLPAPTTCSWAGQAVACSSTGKEGRQAGDPRTPGAKGILLFTAPWKLCKEAVSSTKGLQRPGQQGRGTAFPLSLLSPTLCLKGPPDPLARAQP